MDTPESSQPQNEMPQAMPDRTLAEPVVRIFAYLLEIIPLTFISLVPFIGGLLTGAYMLLRDGLLPGQSFGKRLFNIQVIVESSGKPATFRNSAIRNFPFAITFFLTIVPVIGHFVGGAYALILVTFDIVSLFLDERHRRLGDRLAGTIVIKKLGMIP